MIPVDNPIPADTWTCLVGTCDGTTLKIYINGALVKTRNINNKTPEVNANPVYIGYENGGVIADYFDGRLDEVRLCNRALSAAEIR